MFFFFFGYSLPPWVTLFHDRVMHLTVASAGYDRHGVVAMQMKALVTVPVVRVGHTGISQEPGRVLPVPQSHRNSGVPLVRKQAAMQPQVLRNAVAAILVSINILGDR